MREWRKRIDAEDLSSRQEAEVMVAQIEQARATLTNPLKRAAYDRELAAGVQEQAVPATVGSDGPSWLERAEDYLAAADYHSAAYAAREATHVEGQNAKTWWIRSRANAGLGLWQDALYEGKQATTMEDNNANYHFNLGLIHEQMSSVSEAIDEYRRAGSCDPSNPLYELSVGGVYAVNGRPELALPVIEAVYKKHPDDKTTKYYLGSVLIDLAEQVPRARNHDSYQVQSQEEIVKMRSLCERALSLKSGDTEIRDRANHILKYLIEMEVKSFRPPWALFATSLGGGPVGAIGCLALLLFLAPIILLISALANFGNNAGASIFMLFLAGLIGFGLYKLLYIPKWKQNKRGI